MSYVSDTRYATEALFSLINDGASRLAKQLEVLSSLQAKFQTFDFLYRSMDMSEDFSERQVMHAGAQASAAFSEANALKKQIADLRTVIDDQEFARAALGGAVLQIARQGISMVWGKHQAAPCLRLYGSVCLAEIIYEARNQSAHFETPPHAPAVKVFNALGDAGYVSFNVESPPYKNRALEVMKVIGWLNYSDFERDMTALLAK